MRRTSGRLQVVAVLLGALLLLFAAWLLPPAHSASTTILITAVYYDTYLTGEPDEAFRRGTLRWRGSGWLFVSLRLTNHLPEPRAGRRIK